ncbi:MAG: hypothetical protein LBV41_01240 [Cytophagaceae bacterium]|jgi:hypothetical protein|nr:hypothetical protein [Cytophagaceae bacterium]
MYKLTLTQKDFLNYLLFAASKSTRIRNSRIKSWLMLTGVFFCLGLVFALGENKFLSWYFFVAGLVVFIFYPIYVKQRYRKHYIKYINENLRSRIGMECKIGFVNGCIVSEDLSGESKTHIIDIENISEIGKNLFVRIKTGETLIIPSNINDFDKFKTELKENIKETQPDWNVEYGWKWK